ncbi:MAG: hypothetical protein IPL23_24305 [Saprospiraceae bacterium]|nr:hypothetical protein [Saprospiraceae bacterium]
MWSLDRNITGVVTTKPKCSVTYTIISNAAGRDTAHNVFMKDIIPTGLCYHNLGITGGATLSGSTLTQNVGTL